MEGHVEGGSGSKSHGGVAARQAALGPSGDRNDSNISMSISGRRAWRRAPPRARGPPPRPAGGGGGGRPCVPTSTHYASLHALPLARYSGLRRMDAGNPSPQKPLVRLSYTRKCPSRMTRRSPAPRPAAAGESTTASLPKSERRPSTGPSHDAPARSARSSALAIGTGTDSMARYYPRPGFQRPHTDGSASRQTSPSPASNSQTPPSTPPPTLDYAPRASDDKALTAFAQLGALRLNARRCLISFFDRKDCFLLAEATKTLSLDTGEAEFDDDRLCFGTTIFPKEQSLCYYTVNLAPKYTTLPLEDPSDLPSLIVNDLSKDQRFCNFPFVKGPPYSRFYAGVPIRSPTGHSIGTYCVLDENPRDGLTEHQLAFLKSMAGTVMRHLERTRAAEDHRRAKIMVRSLGSFAEGKSGLENWAQDPWDTEQPEITIDSPEAMLPQRQRPAATTPTEQQPPVLNGHSHIDLSMVGPMNETTPPINHLPHTPSSPTTKHPTLGPSQIVDPVRPVATATTSSTSTKGFPRPNEKDRAAPELRAHFTRAANMIVDSTEAEGVAFFDAKISTFGGLVDDDFDPDQLPEPDKPCEILGAALCKTDRDVKPLPQAGECISESVLRHLLRLYPHGQIFHLDHDPSSPSVNSPSTGLDEFESSDGFPFTSSRKTESSRSLDDEAYLRRVFPTARSLILYPLWDPHRERWFATAVIWSSEPKRIFTTEQELSYLAAFSNFVMAEVARLDTKLADAAKADFISSISHELRSPLVRIH